MRREAPLASLSGLGEMGWEGSHDESTWGWIGSAVLAISAGLCWAVLWVLSGLPPLGQLALREGDDAHGGNR